MVQKKSEPKGRQNIRKNNKEQQSQQKADRGRGGPSAWPCRSKCLLAVPPFWPSTHSFPSAVLWVWQMQTYPHQTIQAPKLLSHWNQLLPRPKAPGKCWFKITAVVTFLGGHIHGIIEFCACFVTFLFFMLNICRVFGLFVRGTLRFYLLVPFHTLPQRTNSSLHSSCLLGL